MTGPQPLMTAPQPAASHVQNLADMNMPPETCSPGRHPGGKLDQAARGGATARLERIANKPVLCLDFDGVIHSYASGWRGADVITDAPVPGALDFILTALDHFEVNIFSARSVDPTARLNMRTWLENHFIEAGVSPADARSICAWRIHWPATKPPAMVTLDDRALTFSGVWPDMNKLLDFKPWYEKVKNRGMTDHDANAPPPGSPGAPPPVSEATGDSLPAACLTRGAAAMWGNYRDRSPAERRQIETVRRMHADLWDYLDRIEGGASRDLALAKTALEDSCMRAVRHLTR